MLLVRMAYTIFADNFNPLSLSFIIGPRNDPRTLIISSGFRMLSTMEPEYWLIADFSFGCEPIGYFSSGSASFRGTESPIFDLCPILRVESVTLMIR
ncbi:hypothetical protein BRARA_B02708 [Brassica rapa]|uniref:Uncharacterized protein n=1 Tax=Brassica campestris TaxID=3711 RepID=A0A398AGB8_BRACM|nr:hypothetical protein BRARA_B02708 [Brassica rapa]